MAHVRRARADVSRSAATACYAACASTAAPSLDRYLNLTARGACLHGAIEPTSLRTCAGCQQLRSHCHLRVSPLGLKWFADLALIQRKLDRLRGAQAQITST